MSTWPLRKDDTCAIWLHAKTCELCEWETRLASPLATHAYGTTTFNRHNM